ncbi:MAG: HD domain-containing protein [Oscillospiraceae bacterium]|nr:HD domain-containing protein [Oscillospiraceae bacterium]
MEALERLRAAGFPAFLVGGCVRDSLLGRTPGDWDITTAALPEQVEAVFAGERIIETGLKHGTVTLLLGGLPLEITTFRTETGYSDHRHPDAVAFTPSLTEDLARRDFTVNAMAWTPEGEGVVDPFGGQADLEKKVIRCVGDPEQRFREDALRILRALRFASQLDFVIDPATAAADYALRDSLELVSRERIAVELTKLLCGPAARRIITEYWEILAVPLPELAPMAGLDQRSKYHCFDVLEHSAAAVEAVSPEPVLRWTALLHDVGKPACFTVDEAGRGHFYGHAKFSGPMAREILTRLRFDHDTVNRVSTLVELHDYPIDPPVEMQNAGAGDGLGSESAGAANGRPPQADALRRAEERAIRKLIGKLGEEDVFRLLALKRADSLAHHPDCWGRVEACNRLEALAREILAQPPCFTVKDLQIDGNDLIALGYPKGPAIGQALNALLEAVLSGELPNRREELLARCKRR